jgi:hypothetical protein
MDTRIKSLFESGCNIVIGFAVSFLSNMIILPIFGMPFKMSSFGLIGGIYTVISLVRSYVIRRLFVNGFYEAIFKNR